MSRITRHALPAFTAVMLMTPLATLLADDNNTSEHRLGDTFRAPPAEFRPLIITHSMPLNRDDATEWLAARRAGGAVIDVGVTPVRRT